MATALDLLMSTKEDVNLLSEESDICTIDAKTRAIFVPSTIVVGGVQSDKNAERIKFSCPKIVGDNLDLSKFSVRINFENVSSVDFNVSIKDQYICDDVAVDGENVTFSWLIGRNAARYMGTVRFIVCAVKTDSDSNISVEWNTAIAEVPVLEGIEIDQPQIGQEEKDVINQLLELTKNTSAEAVLNVNSAKEQAIKDIQSVSQPDTTLTVEGGLAEAKATGEAIGSLKEDLIDVENGFEYRLVNAEFNHSVGVYNKVHELNTGVGINTEILVRAGQKYVISCHNYNENVPCYLIFDENYNLISSYVDDITNEDKHLAVTIPSGGTRLVINSYDINKTYILKEQLVPISDFVGSESQYIDITPQIINGYIDYKKDIYQNAGCHVLFEVTEGEKYKVDGLNFSEGYPLGFCYRKDGANLKTLTGFGNQTRVYGYEFVVDNGVVEVAINSDDIKCLRILKYKKPSTEEIARKAVGIKNKGKKIVWFGTSIPAGCYNPSDSHTSYPMIIGDRLGITVYNESVPSSPVHGMRKSQITESNPYGFFAESFSTACLALACTLEEKEWLISHWNDAFWTGGKYSSMTESQAEYIRNTSYERKLDKYLSPESFPDAFIFDVGRNDIWSDEDAAYTGYDRYTFPNAMHFLIDHIYRYRKDAKIIIIGHYSNQERSKNDTVIDFPQKVAKCQNDIATMWLLPICKTWEKTGWTNQAVYSNGGSKSMLAWNLPDQLHPHSDTSGKATRHMADIICPFIRDNI